MGNLFHFYLNLFIYLLPHCRAPRILVPQPGIEPVPPAVEVHSPNHWPAREFSIYLFIYLFIYLYLIYLFLAVLGLHCCTWAFSSCSERGLPFIAVHGLLIFVASLVVHGLQ